jgi:hypothetical protein
MGITLWNPFINGSQRKDRCFPCQKPGQGFGDIKVPCIHEQLLFVAEGAFKLFLSG